MNEEDKILQLLEETKHWAAKTPRIDEIRKRKAEGELIGLAYYEARKRAALRRSPMEIEAAEQVSSGAGALAGWLEPSSTAANLVADPLSSSARFELRRTPLEQPLQTHATRRSTRARKNAPNAETEPPEPSLWALLEAAQAPAVDPASVAAMDVVEADTLGRRWKRAADSVGSHRDARFLCYLQSALHYLRGLVVVFCRKSTPPADTVAYLSSLPAQFPGEPVHQSAALQRMALTARLLRAAAVLRTAPPPLGPIARRCDLLSEALDVDPIPPPIPSCAPAAQCLWVTSAPATQCIEWAIQYTAFVAEHGPTHASSTLPEYTWTASQVEESMDDEKAKSVQAEAQARSFAEHQAWGAKLKHRAEATADESLRIVWYQRAVRCFLLACYRVEHDGTDSQAAKMCKSTSEFAEHLAGMYKKRPDVAYIFGACALSARLRELVRIAESSLSRGPPNPEAPAALLLRIRDKLADLAAPLETASVVPTPSALCFSPDLLLRTLAWLHRFTKEDEDESTV